MCGIAGQVSFPNASVAQVDQAIKALRHRGPDGVGVYSAGAVAMAHARLSIIDLAGGSQPMFNEDETVAVVFNGEIYNYREIRDQLAGRHHFRTDSDTEVLVHLYEEMGPQFVTRLTGMFSFALWDTKRQRLMCARDRFGEKPFYYSYTDRVFSFASELPAMLEAGLVSRDIDQTAVSNFLELLYIPSPRTILKSVRKLQPGWFMLLDEDGIVAEPFWRPPVPGEGRPEESVSDERLMAAVRHAVEQRMHADVEVGSLLSGGIDSSVVTALMAQSSSRKIKTFSVGFGDADDELPFAREVATAFDTDHHELVVHQPSAEEVMDVLSWYPEPFGDSSAVPTMAVCREVSKFVKVVLTGDGGDELFGGYERYERISSIPRLPLGRVAPLAKYAGVSGLGRKVRRLAKTVAAPIGLRHRHLTEVFDAQERARLLGVTHPSAEQGVALAHEGDSSIAYDLRYYLPDDLLTKVDIAAMRYGLESRSPFLDHTLAELVIPLPFNNKIASHETKVRLRNLASKLVPPSITKRKKRGFGSPIDKWLSAGELRTAMLDTVGAASGPLSNLLDASATKAVVQQVSSGRGNAHQAWALLALDAWLSRHGRA